MANISTRRQALADTTYVEEQNEIDKAVAAEEARQRKKEEKRKVLETDSAYVTCKTIATWMDKYFLDPIIGFFFPGVTDCITQVFALPFVYVALFKVRSIPLTLAVIYNSMKDALLGTIPWIGDLIDAFYRSHVKNYTLIVGFVEDDEEIKRKVNSSAIKCVIGIAIIGVLIYFAVKMLIYVWEQGSNALSSAWQWMSSLF